MGANMEKDKDTKEDQKVPKKGRETSLAEKEGDALREMPQGPLMKVKVDTTPSKSKEEIAKDDEDVQKTDLNMESLKAELDGKNRLAQDYYDKLLRIQAEFDNYKKRTEKELSEFRIYANAELIKDFLAIIDDFQNALTTHNKGSDDEFLKGFELIYKNLYGMLEKEGLSEINPVNEKFDPWKHEAVEMVPTNEQDEHTVMGVVQPGYMFKDKILRPAKVKVATVLKVEEGNSEDEEKEKIEDEKENENDE